MKNAVIVEEERQSRSTWGVGGIVKDLLQGKVGQVEFYFKEIYIDIFPWVDVFRIRYLHRKHIPLLNKKKNYWLFHITWLLPYKYTLCKFLAHIKICVRTACSAVCYYLSTVDTIDLNTYGYIYEYIFEYI